VGNFTHDQFSMDDLKVFEGRQAHDFDKGRERIITTILVGFDFMNSKNKTFA
jgi:hypothetical protein